jgi:CheY-like chemotaxis protein
MKKILVVEDNYTNMYIFSRILRKGGHEVIQATSGEEGVEIAIKEKPDLILMDIQLTDMDGLEATKKIKESKEGKDIPIVALTSYAMVGDREKALAAGCTGYIEKPINPDTFLAKIEKYL